MATTMRTSAKPGASGFKAAYITAFMAGIAVFLVADVVTYVIAHPTFPSPGPLSDIREPVYAICGAIILIALLGRSGRWFATGFVSGLLGMTLPALLASQGYPVTISWAPTLTSTLTSYSEQWLMPEGTAAHDAALAARMPELSGRAAKKVEPKWVTARNRVGLDEATGGRDLVTALTCTIAYNDRFGDYPRQRSKTPGSEVCQGAYTGIYSESDGWDLAYEPISDSKGHVTRFHLRAGPDARLAIDGPWLEVDEQGVMTKRAHTGEPAHGISPMIGTLSLASCIDRNREAYATTGNNWVTLDEMIFHSKVKCPGVNALLIHDDKDPYGQTDPNDLLYILEAPRSALRIKSFAVYTFSYVPRGFTLAEGYDLYLIPHKGESGIRSYLRAADGSVHVTTQTRRASVNDPLALPCELHANEICAS